MFKIEVLISEKNGKKYYKLSYNDVFLTFDEVAILSICDVQPSKLRHLDVGIYNIKLEKI